MIEFAEAAAAWAEERLARLRAEARVRELEAQMSKMTETETEKTEEVADAATEAPRPNGAG